MSSRFLLKISLIIFSTNLLFAPAFSQEKQNFTIKKRTILPRKGVMVPLNNGGNSPESMANNTCSGATSIFYDVPFVDNNIGNTESRPAIQCNGFTSPIANDVWFKFVYTIQMDSLKVVPQNDDSYDIIVELFNGSCASLSTIACSDYAEPNSNNQTEGFLLSSYNLTPGSTYYFRVYGWLGTECNFTALLTAGIPLPPNNDQCSANTQIYAGTTTGGTLVSATQSLPASQCNGVTSPDANDVWFRFLKSASMDSIIVYPDLSSLDLVLEIRSGNCTSNSSVACSDARGSGGIEKISVAGLTNGTTYLVRVYGYNGSSGDFAIKLKSAPTNDNCSGAILISPQLACPSLTIYTTVDASQSLSPITCNGATGASDDDVWFRFVAAGNIDTFYVYPIGIFDPVIDLRSGTCASSATIRCSDNPTNAAAVEKVSVAGLTNGSTYYIRVYSYSNVAGSSGNFRVCLRQTQVALPVNDECPTSIVLAPGGFANAGSSINASQSLPAITCNGFTSSTANDVWYQFTKTDQVDTVLLTPNGTFDPTLELRDNACTGGVTLACSDKLNQIPEKIAVDNLTNGEVYLLRVYGWAGSTGTFSIKLIDAVSAPANDECFSSTSLTVSTACTPISGSNIGSSQSMDPGACSGATAGTANDVWYSFIANGTKAIVKLGCGVGFDGAIEAFSGGCFNLNSIGCGDIYGPSTGTATAVETILMEGLTSGQTYYVRVYGFQGAVGTFDLCVYNPNCNSAVGNLTLSKSTVISNEAFRFTVSGVSGIVDVEYSSDQLNWLPLGLAGGLVDTLIPTASAGTTFYLRAVNQDGACFPSYSAVKTLIVRCATTFTNSSIASGDYIRRVQISNLDNISTTSPMGGSVQDFTQSQPAITLCRGNSYQGILTGNKSNVAYNRLVWIDFNQDGDFSDVGESVYFGSYVTGLTVTWSCIIPANAPLGNTKMRVSMIANGSALSSFDPCAAGPYASGEIEEYAVTISSGIIANAGSSQSTCSSSITLAGNDPGAGNTGLWTVVSGSGTFANSGQFNTLVSGLSAGINVFKWSITGSCGTTQSQVTITSSPIVAIAGTDQGVCSSSATLNATAASSGTGSWSVLSGGASITSTSQNNSGVTNLAIGINKFIWTVTQAGCPAAKDTVTITRTADPSNSDAGAAQNICTPSTQLAANTPVVGTGLWTVVQGNGVLVSSSNPNTQVNGLSQGINRFRWTISNGNCTPKFSEVTVTVLEAPNANAGQDQNICAQNGTLTGNAPANSTYSWSLLSGTGVIANPGASSTAVSGLGVGQNTFLYSVTRGSCPPNLDTVTLIRKAPPTAEAGIAQTVCSANATLGATIPTSGMGVWTVLSGSGTITTPTNPFSTVTSLGIGANVFRWTVSDAPCQPATSDVTITRSAGGVVANGGNNATICDPNYTLNGNSPGTGTGVWTLISGSGTIATPGSASSQVSGLGVGINVFRWSISNGICPSTTSDVAITRTPSTTISAAGQNQTVCAFVATLSANTPTQGTGVWSVINGTGQFSDPNSPTPSVSGLSVGANTFRWTISNAPCASSFSEVTITSSGTATTANAGLNQVICANTTSLSGNAAAQGVGIWSLVSGTGTIAEPNNPNTQVSGLGVGNAIFRWTITNGVCLPTTSDVVITRNSNPAVPNVGNSQTICGSSATLSATNIPVGSGTWSLVSGTGTIQIPNAPSTQVVGLGAGANVFRFTVTNPPCGAVSADVTITTNLSAPSANAGQNQLICQNSGSLSGNLPSPGTGLWTVISGSGTIATPSSPTSAVSNLGLGNNVFRWTITSGTCPPSTSDVTIAVNAQPSASNAGNDQNVCGSVTTLGANSPSVGTGSWSVVSGAGQFTNSSSANSQVINMDPGVNVFRWTISNASCTPTQSTVTINSTPSNLTAIAGIDQVVCGSTATLLATSPTLGTGSWTVLSGAASVLNPGQAVSQVVGLAPGFNNFLWIVTNGSCTATDIVTIIRETNPVNLGADTLICIEQATSFTLTGPSAMNSYLWSTGAATPFISVTTSGVYNLRVSTTNGCIFYDTVKVNFVICTDVKDPIAAAKSISSQIVPNPSSSQAFVKISVPNQESVFIEIMDLTGRVITHIPERTLSGDSEISLPTDGIPSGTYLVKIQGQHFYKSLKWVITR